MKSALYNIVLNKEHHKYRRRIDLNLAAEYSMLGLKYEL